MSGLLDHALAIPSVTSHLYLLEELIFEDCASAASAVDGKNMADVKRLAGVIGQRTSRVVRIGQTIADASHDAVFKHHVMRAVKEVEKGILIGKHVSLLAVILSNELLAARSVRKKTDRLTGSIKSADAASRWHTAKQRVCNIHRILNEIAFIDLQY